MSVPVDQGEGSHDVSADHALLSDRHSSGLSRRRRQLRITVSAVGPLPLDHSRTRRRLGRGPHWAARPGPL